MNVCKLLSFSLLLVACLAGAAEEKTNILKSATEDGSATLKQNDVLSLPAVHLNRLLHLKP